MVSGYDITSSKPKGKTIKILSIVYAAVLLIGVGGAFVHKHEYNIYVNSFRARNEFLQQLQGQGSKLGNVVNSRLADDLRIVLSSGENSKIEDAQYRLGHYEQKYTALSPEISKFVFNDYDNYPFGGALEHLGSEFKEKANLVFSGHLDQALYDKNAKPLSYGWLLRWCLKFSGAVTAIYLFVLATLRRFRFYTKESPEYYIERIEKLKLCAEQNQVFSSEIRDGLSSVEDRFKRLLPAEKNRAITSGEPEEYHGRPYFS